MFPDAFLSAESRRLQYCFTAGWLSGALSGAEGGLREETKPASIRPLVSASEVSKLFTRGFPIGLHPEICGSPPRYTGPAWEEFESGPRFARAVFTHGLCRPSAGPAPTMGMGGCNLSRSERFPAYRSSLA